jgi:polyisoprenoid-binding protein YceI
MEAPEMKKSLLLGTLLLAISPLALAADTYTIDAVHSSANFAVKHLGLSTVHGRFAEVNGTVVYDEKAPENSTVTAIIKTASINTDNKMRDDDLRSDAFLNAAKYPEIRFQSTHVRKTGADSYVASGKLTIRDVTRDVEIPFTLSSGKGMSGKPRLGVDASLVIDRFDYNVNFGKSGPMSGVVGKDVKIDLEVEAEK